MKNYLIELYKFTKSHVSILSNKWDINPQIRVFLNFDKFAFRIQRYFTSRQLSVYTSLITGAISMLRRWSVSHTDLLQELFQCRDRSHTHLLHELFRCSDSEAYHIQIYYRSYFDVAIVKRITYRSITGAISMSRRWSVSHTDLLQELFRCSDSEAYHIQIYYMSYFDVAIVKHITYRSITWAISMSQRWSVSHTDLLQELFQCRDGEAYHLQIYYRSYFNVMTVKHITYRSITGAISMLRRWSVSHTSLFQCRDGEAYQIQIYYRSYFNVMTVKPVGQFLISW